MPSSLAPKSGVASRAARALAGAATGLLLLSGTAAAAPTTVDWPSYNNDLRSERYSSLAQITPQNVGKLHKICSRPLGPLAALQGTPLVVGGVLYVTMPFDTFALDARTCAVRWHTTYRPADAVPFPVDRGLALANGRIVRGEPDGHLISIDAQSGKTLWNVAPASGKRGEFLSAAPIVWNGVVFMGVAGSDWGVKGRMMAFDLATGKKLWTFTTIATGNDPGAKSWGSVRATETGGGGTWTSYTLDPAAGELFVPVANPAPDFAAAYRPGSNLYTDSLVVLDAKTGKLKWYYQMTPHDSHDWDMAAPPVLYTTASGKSYVGAASKDGNIYILDRATHRLVARIPGDRQQNYTVAPTVAGVHICPGALGGSEWNGPAFDAKDHLLITPMDDWCNTLKLGATRYVTGQFFFGGTYLLDPVKTARGTLTAVDDATGAKKWQYTGAAPMLAGVTPTASGLTFTGDMAGNLLAFDSATGKVLYRAKTGGSIAGGVVTYAVGGKQYVAATSGNISRLTWGNGGTPAIVVYAL